MMNAMPRVLLTAFEPFDGRSMNSSLETAKAVAAQPPPGVELDWLVLPVVIGECLEQAWAWIERESPALVLALGQAGGAAAFQIEQQAVNVHNFFIPDNAGNQPREQFIYLDGPVVYPTTFASRHIHRELRRRRLPAHLSTSAGTYVCNHLLYGLLHQAAVTGRTHQTGFIHLPMLPEQVQTGEREPALSLEQLAEGIRVAIAACMMPPDMPLHKD
jgi:pyroglutamyl-peptidase